MHPQHELINSMLTAPLTLAYLCLVLLCLHFLDQLQELGGGYRGVMRHWLWVGDSVPDLVLD